MKLVFSFTANKVELFRNGQAIETTHAEFGLLCSLAHSAKVARTTGVWSGELELHDVNQSFTQRVSGLPLPQSLKDELARQLK